MTQKELAKQIADFASRHPLTSNINEVIDDIVQLDFNMLTSSGLFYGAFPNGAIWAKGEYLVSLEKYRNHPQAWHELQNLALAFNTLIFKGEPFQDIIGGLYNDTLAKSQAKALGQFLTPHSVSEGLARWVDEGQPQQPFVLSDPTGCGAGSLILARLSYLVKTHGAECLKFVHVVLNDLDPGMAKLAAVQVGWSAVLHRIPLGSLGVYCANIITEYDRDDTIILKMIPDAQVWRDYMDDEDEKQLVE